MNALRPLCAAWLLLSALTATAAADPIPYDALRPRAEALKPDWVEPDEGALANVLVLKMREGSHVRLEGDRLEARERSEAEAFRLERAGVDPGRVEDDLLAINDLLSEPSVQRVERMFVGFEPAGLAAEQAMAEQAVGEELADLDLYYHVVLEEADPHALAQLAEALNSFEAVEIAYAQPIPSAPAPDLMPPAGDLSAPQAGYQGPAPIGLDAQYAWTLAGGRGEGMRMIDIETNWVLAHEDLPAVFVTEGALVGGAQHGVASLGIVVAERNGYGMTGMASDTEVGVISPVPFYDVPAAILSAARKLDPGNVLLIEQHYPGPTHGATCTGGCGQFGYVAVENAPGDFDAIRRAVAMGIIVIEPAGNGSMDLDHARYNGRFDRAVRDSGAIMVGAGFSNALAPHGWSNAGSRVDVHAWGDSVATLGYGDIRPAPPFDGDERQWYTNTFGGTSSASPMVAAAALSIQGVRMAAGLDRLDPAAMRRLLVATGSPQTGGTRNIGPRPNIRAAIEAMHLEPFQQRMVHTADATNTPGGYTLAGWGCWPAPCVPGPIFVWENAPYTVIDHPFYNGRPDLTLQVTPRVSAFAGNPHPTGVRYDTGTARWTIVNLDDQPMIDGARFSLLRTHGFRQISTPQNTTQNQMWIDHPIANQDPWRSPLVTRWTGTGDVRLPHPIAAVYDFARGQWAVTCTDGAPIPDGAGFHISLRGSGPQEHLVVAGLAPAWGDAIILAHPMLDGHPEAIPVVTAFESHMAARVPADLAVRWDDGLQQWLVQRTDGGAFPNLARIRVYVARELLQSWERLTEAGAGATAPFTAGDGDSVHIDGAGEIWAGVAFTGRNDAEGWPGYVAGGAYPLPGGPQYGLIAQLGGQGWVPAGRHFEAVVAGAPHQAIDVRINDDMPGNGDHWFQVRVRRFRE